MPFVMRGGHKGGIAMFAFNFCPEYRRCRKGIVCLSVTTNRGEAGKSMQ